MDFNFEEYSEELYLTRDNLKFTDLSTSFNANGFDNDLEILSNLEAIKQSIVNIIFTPLGSMNILLNVGSDIVRFLGQPISSNVAYSIGEEIKKCLQEGDKRLDNISVNMLILKNGYEAYVTYDVPGLKVYNQTTQLDISTQ
jgi:phage baseplate assembly protein W